MKYCDLIVAATIVAAHTSSVYGCDQTLLQQVPPSNQTSEQRKGVSYARLSERPGQPVNQLEIATSLAMIFIALFGSIYFVKHFDNL